MGRSQVVIGVIWLGRLMATRFADQLATFALPTLDRSPLATGDFSKQAV